MARDQKWLNANVGFGVRTTGRYVGEANAARYGQSKPKRFLQLGEGEVMIKMDRHTETEPFCAIIAQSTTLRRHYHYRLFAGPLTYRTRRPVAFDVVESHIRQGSDGYVYATADNWCEVPPGAVAGFDAIMDEEVVDIAAAA